MRKFFTAGFILSMFLLCFVTPSNAIPLIEVDPISQTVPVGDTAEVALIISGLGDGIAPSVSEFDLEITFDPALLDFDLNSVEYGDPVLGDQLDLFGLGSWQITTPGGGNVILFELSFDTPFDLEDIQAASFTLASFSFDTLAVGTSFLDIEITTLADAFGNPLESIAQGGSISAVPEPATIFLVVSGLFGMGVLGRKKFEKKLRK